MNISKTKDSKLKSALGLCTYFGALLVLYCASDLVLASGGGDIGSVATTITGTLSSVSKLIVAGSYVAGIGFALMGMLKFKAHKDNPAQVPLSQPIMLLAIAAGLVFLPSLITTAGSTIFGSSAKQGSSSGSGLQ